MDSVARDYIYRRFPSASDTEKDKIVVDWMNKVEAAKKIAVDFSERIGTARGKKILDAGCGNGGLSIALALSGAEPVGLEVEKELYEISKKHADAYGVDIRPVLYGGEIMPFGDNHFDAALSSSVLEHVSDPGLYLKEILRVVRPGGELYLAFPNKLWPKETHTSIWFLTYLPRFIQPLLLGMFRRGSLEDYHLHFYSYSDLQKLLSAVAYGKYSWKIIPESGKSLSGAKFIVKKILGLLGIPYKTFLSHISVILKKVG